MYKRSRSLPSMPVLSLQMSRTEYASILRLIIITWTSLVLIEACPNDTTREEIEFVWNAPTFQCLNLGTVICPGEFGIQINEGQQMIGEKIAIFYSLGQFPSIDSNGTWIFGGVPQNGNLSEHLLIAEQQIIAAIPDEDFSGLGVIDFEAWRPVWSMATGTQLIYKNASIELVQNAHPDYNQTAIKQEASNQFEQAGRMFMIETLNVCKRLRPNGKWGYYGYPMVDNYIDGEYNLSPAIMIANDEIEDLFGNSTALFPSIYVFKDSLTSQERAEQVQERINETVRIRTNPDTPIYPYFWFTYHEMNEFLTQDDLEDIIGMVYDSPSNGMVIWGSSKQMNTSQECDTLKNYLNTMLGPIIKSAIQCSTPPTLSSKLASEILPILIDIFQ